MENISQPDSNTLLFSVRIVSIDYYMSPPITNLDISHSTFQGGKVNEVPVIRIYGSTPAGQKTCLHLHRALPYLYIPCSVSIHSSEQGDKYTRDIANAIEKAFKVKGLQRQHVHDCSLVRAKKFYGYYKSEELFVKIYLYYPHEVARVATLLLDGAILGRSYQPYESHIPYLLQFLVEYNLYGMGHLHVSKVKFRCPLPDGFIPRGAQQSDSGHGSCLGMPIWTSTTVQTGWIWPHSTETDSSPDQELCLIKRQSICELEGDATVDDILNQQFKMYSPLSQTCSDVKMVQSLVPMWQEEYERTGVHEEVIHSDPSKPLPENVLKTLSHGPEFEDALLYICSKAEKSSSSQGPPSEDAERFLHSIRSLVDVGSLREFSEHDPICSQRDSFQRSEEVNRSGSTSSCSLSKHGDDAESSEARHKLLEIVPADEAFNMSGSSDPKGIDTEALGLLRWLASSEAAEDLNTDDELGYDMILTPLLPKTAIGKILDKANLDYERESQQECQDILDSVLDTNSCLLKEQALHSTSGNHLTHMPAGNIIPQVDGSFDDLVTGSVRTSKKDIDSEMGRSSSRVIRGTNIRCSSGKKKRGRLWGTLPFSSLQKASDSSESSSFNSTDVSNEMKDCTTSISSGKKDDEGCEASVTDTNANDRGLKKQKEVTESATRDLMRRKRYRRVEASEGGTCRVMNICTGKEEEKTSLSPKRLEFHMKNDDMEDMIPNRMSVNPLFTDHAATACEKSSCLPTCVSGEVGNIYGFRPAYGETSFYGKLPLMSSGDCSLRGSTPKKEHFISHKLLDDVEPFGGISNTENIILTDVCGLKSATKEVPKSLNSPKKDTATSTGQPERSIVPKESELFLRCSTPFDNNGQDACNFVNWIPAMCSDSYRNTIAATNANIPQSENFAIEQKIQTCSSFLSLPSATPSERMCAQSVEMSFSKKPPLNNWKNWTSEDAAVVPVVHDQNFIVDMEDCEGILVEGGVSDDVFPFFSDNVGDVEEVNDRNNEVIKSSGEAVIGIPTHYQNDGSLLYLLTTVYSPPSVDSISEWLLHHPPKHDATGTRKNISSKVLESPSPGGSNRLDFSKENDSFNDGKTASEPPKLQSVLADDLDMIYSQEHLVNNFHEFSDKSGHVPHMEPSSDQLIQKDNRNSMKVNNLSEVMTERHSEGTLMKGNEHIDSCQDISQISGPDMRSKLTPLSQTGFRDPASVGAGQQLTLMSIEVQAESRGDLRPDPRIDAVTVIAVRIQDDNDLGLETFVLLRGNEGESFHRNLDAISGCTVIVVLEEKHLFYHFVKIVRSSDPDILMGWEIQGGSLGFLAERAAHLGILLLSTISRTPSYETEARNSATEEIRVPDDLLPEALVTDAAVFGNTIIEDEWGRTHASGVHVGGRIVLNIWRLMRGEVKLNMYTMEAVAEEVLRRKVPLIPPRILAQWFSSGPGRARFRCIEYIIERTKLNLEIMDQLDMINRTSELARVFGIDFFSVLSRGSQYRVESMFLRLAHTQNYLAISPGNQQVASQPAMECLPLVMEPESRFYADPVVVLDFQSLYPSMIIAYNLCFCTCLGKVIPAKEDILGVCSYIPDPQHLMDIKNRLLLTPNGVMYVPSEVRKGVLPRLLEEILSTRIMVKRAMKSLTPSERVLYRIFNARQLALKLISNVTYGYTAAGFSGRMPCAELADSIVQCGRRTLENAISYVNSHDKWKARVIYGDTDSMFVLLKGRTMKESFSIGQEIASVITSMNPAPVTLKMEKVYHPCFLLMKKRYVGYSYETPDQVEPSFDAKGIETVRRDSCGAVAKTMEQSLRLFFEHQDISKVKAYLQRQWTRILAGRVSLHDFVFAKEVRLGTYSNRSSSLPPAAIVAIKAMKTDPRAEPRYAERVPYAVIHGEPGARLVDMVVDPLDLLATDSPFSLNDLYYINKQIIPALQRVFGLVGADLKRWFSEMPRPVRSAVGKRFSYALSGQRTRIDYYYLSRHCILCGELVQASNHFCDNCSKNEAAVATAMVCRTSKLEREVEHLAAICRHCGGGDWIVDSGIKCVSLACTVFYERRKVQKELHTLSGVAADIGFYPRCMVELF